MAEYVIAQDSRSARTAEFFDELEDTDLLVGVDKFIGRGTDATISAAVGLKELQMLLDEALAEGDMDQVRVVSERMKGLL